MPADKNINEQLLSDLIDRYHLLSEQMEATTREIKALGGRIPAINGFYQNSIGQHTHISQKAQLLKNEWADKVIAAMLSLAKPCSAKEITEMLYSSHLPLSMSWLYIKVSNALRLLLTNEIIEKHIKNAQKYVFK